MDVIKYYQILGVNERSSESDIKKAFRSKAKVYHPDINKSPTAHEEFLLLNEAYDYLINKKTGKTYSAKTRSYTRSQRPRDARQAREEWNEEQRKKARARAEKFTQMDYEQFIRSDFYFSLFVIENISSMITTGFLAGLFIVLPLIVSIMYGLNGLLIGLFVIAITSPVWAGEVRELRSKKSIVSFKSYYFTIRYILATFWGQFIISLILNMIIYLTIVMFTLITLADLLLAYAAVSLVALLSVYLKERVLHKRNIIVSCLIIAPLAMNLFFTLNYFISGPAEVETYTFSLRQERSRRGTKNTSLLILENNTYSDYPAIRFFWEYESIRGGSVNYTIAKGLFGIPVVKERTFNNMYSPTP